MIRWVLDQCGVPPDRFHVAAMRRDLPLCLSYCPRFGCCDGALTGRRVGACRLIMPSCDIAATTQTGVGDKLIDGGAIMKVGALIFLGFAGFITQPALAQTPATTPAAPATTLTSLDGLLASGYEVKAVIELSETAVKALVPAGQTVASQVIVTLQKGSSVATCEVYTANWIQLPDATVSSPTLCSKR